jgi:hypothetical protein
MEEQGATMDTGWEGEGSAREFWFAAGRRAIASLATAATAGQQVFQLDGGDDWTAGDLAFVSDVDGGQLECLGPALALDGAWLHTRYAALRDRAPGAPVWRPSRWAVLPTGPAEWTKMRDDGMERVDTLDGERRNIQTRAPGVTIRLRYARVALSHWRGLMDFLRADDGAAWGARDFAFSGWDRETRRWAVDHARLISGVPEFCELALGWPGLEMELQVVATDAYPDEAES